MFAQMGKVSPLAQAYEMKYDFQQLSVEKQELKINYDETLTKWESSKKEKKCFVEKYNKLTELSSNLETKVNILQTKLHRQEAQLSEAKEKCQTHLMI